MHERFGALVSGQGVLTLRLFANGKIRNYRGPPPVSHIDYMKLVEVDPPDFLTILNKQTIRNHLVDHQMFDAKSIRTWIREKIEMDTVQGCKVRAVVVDGRLAGWCGIQLESRKYEIALVLDDRFWGLGQKIFRDIMAWAKELGHKTVFLHFLDTRPKYRFLQKISRTVTESELMGRKFTTYELMVK